MCARAADDLSESITAPQTLTRHTPNAMPLQTPRHLQQSEDCLYLNVYTGSKASATNLAPVVIFLYGGSWKYGSAASPLYGEIQTELLENNKLVYVTVNYRLGAFGFLGSSDLASMSADGSTGNYGLQDQRAAMQWVRDNIAAFGGDPTRVTIQGESAGAGSVSDHMFLPKSKGLFHQAISESGPVGAPWTSKPMLLAEQQYARVLKAAGCDQASSELRGAIPPKVACLQALTAEDLLKAGDAADVPSLLTWSPVVDGVELTATPAQLLAAGKVYPVPYLVGSNENEGTMFIRGIPQDLNATDYTARLMGMFGNTLGQAIAAQYPPSQYASPWHAFATAFGDGAMTCPTRRAARAFAPHVSVYQYFYTHVLDAVSIFDPSIGVFHGSELVMVFDFELLQWTDDEKALAKDFVNYWTNFIVTGTPSGQNLTTWNKYSSTVDNALRIDVASAGGSREITNLKSANCNFWDQHTINPSTIFGGNTTAAAVSGFDESAKLLAGLMKKH